LAEKFFSRFFRRTVIVAVVVVAPFADRLAEVRRRDERRRRRAADEIMLVDVTRVKLLFSIEQAHVDFRDVLAEIRELKIQSIIFYPMKP